MNGACTGDEKHSDCVVSYTSTLFFTAYSLVEIATERDSTQIKLQQVHPVSRHGCVLSAKQASEGEGNHDSGTHQGCNHTGLDAS